ncbi:uncharacterized protein LOC125479547 [Pyrus x bretschneideri]|uniref:uncharacterized protein LOC125479547 n=1 Tax=Pyrus x bretschneideri TaxID=225117 RepID=UPI0020305071|nr:uncharacterized protein LOC125479547 [Pyrus x bretschneideri]
MEDNQFRFSGEAPNYEGLDQALWTVEIHHGGELLDLGYGHKIYSGGSVVWVDNINRDYTSKFDFDDFAKALGYREPLEYYYRVPGTECKYGVESKVVGIADNVGFNSMFDNMPRSRVVIYFFSRHLPAINL